MKRRRKKKGQLGTLNNVILGLVVIGFVIAIALLLFGNFKTQIHTTEGNSSLSDYQAINSSLDAVTGAIDDVPGYMGIIILAFIALVVIGVILLLRRNRR